MAINEAEILRALSKQDLGKDSSKVYFTALTVLADEIVQDFKDVIEKETRSDNGALKASIVPFDLSNKGFSIEGDFYYKFIDDGVNAAPSGPGSNSVRPLVQGAPYSFKNLGVPANMVQSVREWSGGSMAQAYAIAVSIKKHGIQPKNITEQVWNDKVIERVSTDLSRITGLAVTVVFNKNMND